MSEHHISMRANEPLLHAVEGGARGPSAAATIEKALGHFPSPAMRGLSVEIQRLAANSPPIDVPLLITGETGVGKNWLARVLHEALQGELAPFVHINCNNLPRDLAISMIGGYEKGAFTGAMVARSGVFEEAGSGTVFLDEIGDLPPDLQGILHDVLDERTIRRLGGRGRLALKCRILFATSKLLGVMVGQGSFRSELFWRLSGFPLEVPPLRDRKEDLEILCRHFMGRRFALLSPKAVEKLGRHSWPGNVRELKQTLVRAMLTKDPSRTNIEPKDIKFDAQLQRINSESGFLDTVGQCVGRSVDEMIAAQIAVTLERFPHQKDAAPKLGISTRVLNYELNHGPRKGLIAHYRSLL